MLETPAFCAQLVLLIRLQPRGLQLAHLEAEQVLALGAVALGGAQVRQLLARHSILGVEGRHAVPQRFHPREAIENLELRPGLGEALVLVLAVHLDEMVAQPLQERHGHRRIVHEGAVAARTDQLPSDDDLPVLGPEPRLLQDLPGGAARVHGEHALDPCDLRVAPDGVGLGACTPQEEHGIDEDGLARPRLAGQDVQARGEWHGDVLDHGQVTNTKLAEHGVDARPALPAPSMRIVAATAAYRSPHFSFVLNTEKKSLCGNWASRMRAAA